MVLTTCLLIEFFISKALEESSFLKTLRNSNLKLVKKHRELF